MEVERSALAEVIYKHTGRSDESANIDKGPWPLKGQRLSYTCTCTQLLAITFQHHATPVMKLALASIGIALSWYHMHRLPAVFVSRSFILGR